MEPRSPPLRRRSGANTAFFMAEQPNNTTVDVLGDHWKSALCVTSLYDSYVALQHENESLKDQLRQAQHTNELLAVETRTLTTTTKQLRLRPEGESDDDDGTLVKEIRLLRAEKSQQELLFDKRRSQLESERDEYKALYKEQQLKYQQKFDLDPMEPQRVALSTRTLQDALDVVVREKEELVIKHSKLQQLYVSLEQDHKRTTAMLQAQVAEMESRRVAQATHRVRAVLDRWVLTKISHSWKQWRLVVLSERLQAKQREDEKARMVVVEAKQRSVVQERAAKMVMKLLQSTTRRCFSEWKRRAGSKKALRQQLHGIHQKRDLEAYRRVFETWRADVRRRQGVLGGCERLERLMARRRKSRALRTWTRTILQSDVGQLLTQNKALESEFVQLNARVSEQSRVVTSVKAERDDMENRLLHHATTHQQQLQTQCDVHDVAMNRIGDVLFQRTQRLSLQHILRSWRQEAVARRCLKRQIAVFTHHHETKKVTKSVRQWAATSHEQRRTRQITGRFLRRMRMVGAYRCFLAWRDFAATSKVRTATLKRVVNHMKNQQLIKCFVTWKAFREAQHERWRRLAGMCSILERALTIGLFNHWKKASVALSAAAEQAKRQQIESEWRQRLEQSKHELKQLRQYFHTWQKTTKSDKRFRQLTTKCAVKWKNGTLGRCLEAWKGFVERRCTARELVRRRAVRREASELLSAWTRWRTQTLIKTKELKLLDFERERDAQMQRMEEELAQLRLAQSALQVTSAEREHTLTLELHATRETLSGLQSVCAQYKGCLKAVCLSVSQRRTVLKSLRGWQDAVERAKHRRLLVETATAKRNTQVLRRVFSAWNSQLRKRLKMNAMVRCLLSRWHEYTLVDCYRAWALYARKRSSVRQAAVTFSRNSQYRLHQAVFTAWRDDARKTRLLRKTLEQIWLTSVRVHMHECFRKWSALAREETLKEDAARRDQVLAAIQAKICGRWTACSLKAVFAAWKQGVSRQKQSRLGQQRLRRLQQLRLLVITFTEWKALCQQVNAQAVWLNKWQAKLQTKNVAQALQQWKAVTIQYRQEQLVSLKASRDAQEAALVIKLEEVETLQATNKAIHAQVDALMTSQTSMELLTERLGKRVCVAKWFYKWRAGVEAVVHARVQLARFRARRMERSQRRILCGWYCVVEERLAREASASRLIQKREANLSRMVWQAWVSFVHAHTHMKRVLLRFQGRRQRGQQRDVLDVWKLFTTRAQTMRRVVSLLQQITTNVSVAGGFEAWKRATQLLKQQEADASEKKRRVMMMMLAREENALSRCFATWKAAALARLDRMKLVARLAERIRKRRLAETLQMWRRNMSERQCQTRQSRRLVWLYERQRLRIGLRRWMSQIERWRLATIAANNQELVNTNVRLQQELEKSSIEVRQLSASVLTLEETQQRRTDDMETAMVASETVWAATTREAQRKLVLTRLLLCHRHVDHASVAVAQAFQLWRLRSMHMSRQLEALSRCSHLLMRKRQARCFFMWRRRAAIQRRLEGMERKAAELQSRVAWNAWQQFFRDRSMRRRRFLVRWIEVTHTLQTQAALAKKTATAFRIWQLQASLEAASKRLAEAAKTKSDEQTARVMDRREKLLAKWCWRAYTGRCTDLRVAVGRWKSLLEIEKTKDLEKRIVELHGANTSGAGNNEAPSTALSEQTMSAVSQSLQTLFRRLASVVSAPELFEVVATLFPQLIHPDISAMMYLLDPSANELWTCRASSQQPVRVSSALGIAGYALTSRSSILVVDAASNPRYHPLVDHVVTAGNGMGFSLHTGSVRKPVALFSAAIVASDGNAYGVVQVAYPDPGTQDSAAISTQIQLLARACSFFVEQILHEMVRHCRDRVVAQSPEHLVKLFKQNKNWRKYFVQVERAAQKAQQQLQQILKEQEFLVQEKDHLQRAMDQVEADRKTVLEAQTKAEQDGQTQEKLMKYVSAYKKKTAMVKEMVQAKEQELRVKSLELEKVSAELVEARRQVRTMEWQAILSAKATPVSPKKRSVTTEEGDELPYRSKQGGLLKGAEVATLKNELVRAESDSMLLVKAVDVATRHHGELPEMLKMEVNRIALRLKKTTE